MNQYLILLFVCLQLTVHACRAAGDKGAAAQYLPCRENAAGVAAVAQHCMRHELAWQNKRLTENYNRYIRALAPPARNKTMAAQRLWLNFRDMECDARRATAAPGSLAELLRENCYLELTRQRADDFSRRSLSGHQGQGLLPVTTPAADP